MQPAPGKEHRWEQSEMLDFLLEISAVSSETLDLDHLLVSVGDMVRRVIPYELFAILLFHEKRKDLRIVYSVGHNEEVVRNLAIPVGEGVTGAAAASGQPVLVGDVREDPRYLNALDAVRSELAVPMVARGKLVGVIDMQSTTPHAYTQDDRALLRLIASRVAAAIDNARLYRRTERQNRTFSTLAQVSQEFSAILNLDELLTRISYAVRKLVPYDAFSILLVDSEQRVLRHRFSVRYDRRVDADHIPLGQGITGAAAEARATVRVRDTARDPRYIATQPGISSELAVPLVLQEKVIGVVNLESERLGFFTEDHQRVLELLAPQIAISIENARLYEQVAAREKRIKTDLEAARELQGLLLPAQAPPLAGLESGIGYRPAREIGGDLYDFFEHERDHVLIAFGDVSGKGAAAALYAALVTGLMRPLAARQRAPAEILKTLNDSLLDRHIESRYLALLLLLWHPHSRELTMANAGALPPMIFRKGEIVKLRVEGVPVGLLPGREYEEITFQTEPGDILVLFSDGITDHLNAAGEEYGRKRLAQVVLASSGRPAQEIVQAIFDSLDAFHTKAFDDQTLLVLKAV
jgi:phosphoserine phosphatase RsbU/P